MEKYYLVYSQHSFLGKFDSLYDVKSACFKDFNNEQISYYTIYVIRDGKLTRTHFSRIQFHFPTPDVCFPEFVLDYGQRIYHYVLFGKK